MLLTHSDPIRKNNVNITGNLNSTSTLIFAHGFGTDQTAWLPVIEAFKNDHRIILYDNVGAGKALPEAYSPNKYNSLQSYADDLTNICERLNISNAIIVAHSVSAMIAVLTTIGSPQFFKKMILIGASPCYRNDPGYTGGFEQKDLDDLYRAMDTNYFAWVSGFSSMAMANPDRPELAQSFADTLSAIRPDIALAVARVIFQSDCREKLQKLDKETLLIQTKEDIAVPLQVAEYLHRHISNSKLIIVNASGHFPHISASQEIVNAIQHFLIE
ncbi:alpha/beta fold hydrolase [Mucilaginibacter paludis]|uniref:Alpha/beta hydrolase fold containing protein n=1 Tax=Mucilaginibacter paludis DSM 18603 TaxID=714943 RepID=H1YGI1_9SPHI|nr:alpha/beta hydrolase [Mucilaginibacter paludis]EHQ24533.1 alpha/beta hydrolase fold containing protein [Mucilaginibacter paludis DSM 18603]